MSIILDAQDNGGAGNDTLSQGENKAAGSNMLQAAPAVKAISAPIVDHMQDDYCDLIKIFSQYGPMRELEKKVYSTLPRTNRFLVLKKCALSIMFLSLIYLDASRQSNSIRFTVFYIDFDIQIKCECDIPKKRTEVEHKDKHYRVAIMI
ncbi:hypothetical protein ACJX0J_035484 [Zea mays]